MAYEALEIPSRVTSRESFYLFLSLFFLSGTVESAMNQDEVVRIYHINMNTLENRVRIFADSERENRDVNDR